MSRCCAISPRMRRAAKGGSINWAKSALSFSNHHLSYSRHSSLGPYIKEVRKIFRILDPLPPLSAFLLDL